VPPPSAQADCNRISQLPEGSLPRLPEPRQGLDRERTAWRRHVAREARRQSTGVSSSTAAFAAGPLGGLGLDGEPKKVAVDDILVMPPDAVGKRVSERRYVLAVSLAWPANFAFFVRPVVTPGDYAVVLLCRDPPSNADVAKLCSFEKNGAPLVKLVIGDALRREDLIRAGCRTAHSICVFSSPEDSDELDAADECDHAPVLASAKILALLQEADVAGGVPLITEVRNASTVPYLDPTDWWPDNSMDQFAYVESPIYASGHTFAESMLYPLVGYTYFMPLILDLVQACLGDDLGTERLQLCLIPSSFVGHRFSTLFHAMIAEARRRPRARPAPLLEPPTLPLALPPRPAGRATDGSATRARRLRALPVCLHVPERRHPT
jgi:hypothetical protein